MEAIKNIKNTETKTCQFDGFSIDINKHWLMKQKNDQTTLFKGPEIGKGNLLISMYSDAKEELKKGLEKVIKGDTEKIDYKTLYIAKMKIYKSEKKDFRLISESKLEDLGLDDQGVFCEYTYFDKGLESEILIRSIYSETETQFIIISAMIPGGENLESILELSTGFLNSFKILQN